MPGLGGWRGLSGLGGQRWSGWTEKVWVICVQEKANCPSPPEPELNALFDLAASGWQKR